MKISVLWVSAQASLALVPMGLMKHKSMQSFLRLWMSGLTPEKRKKTVTAANSGEGRRKEAVGCSLTTSQPFVLGLVERPSNA
ncbi:MAG: hypothetical protein AABN34_26170 [Acidobacteriota bacterium]